MQVKACSSVDPADLVTVEPESEDDWELVELNASFFQQNMLQQVNALVEMCTLVGHA